MSSAGNWVAESSSTSGQGNLTLTGTDVGFARFRDAIPAGEVYYSIKDGENREAGRGNFDGIATIVRTNVDSTLFAGVYDNVSPSAIFLSGESIVSCTFNTQAYNELRDHLVDTSNPHGVIASQVPYDSTEDPVSSEGNVQDGMLDHGNSIEQRVASMSGVITGGTLSISSATEFDIADGFGEVFDSYTFPNNTSVEEVTWLNLSNITLDTGGLTLGATSIFITAAANILQIPGATSPAHFRQNIYLGAVEHVSGVIQSTTNAPVIVKQTATDLHDVLTLEVSLDGSTIEPVTAQLQVWLEEGTVFSPGINWYTDKLNPNVFTLVQEGNETTPISVIPITQTGLLGTPVNDMPEFYNPTGDTLTPLTGQNATIHRLYNLGVNTREFILLYGQNSYANATEAKENLFTDGENTVFPPELEDRLFLGWIGIGNNAPDFDDVDDAWIVSRISGSGSASGGETNDHTVLINRDASDQHPLSAITGAQTEIDTKMEWFNAWVNGTLYEKNSAVRDGAWTMVANTQTSERPAPVPTGDQLYVYEGASPTDSVLASQLITGNRYTVQNSGYLVSYRVYTVTGNRYSVVFVEDPLGTPIIETLSTFTAGSTGWITFNITTVILQAGLVFDLYTSVSEPDPTPTTFNGDWNYSTPQNAGVPAAGQAIQGNSTINVISISKTDNNAADRTAELATLDPGDIIESQTVRWAIQAINDNGTYYSYSVAPAAQAEDTGVQNFVFETVTATPITHMADPNWWPGSNYPSTEGLYSITGIDNIATNTNAYGTDITVQAASVSADWDLLASSGDSSGSGGGGDGALTGEVKIWPVATTPVGYLACEGAAVDRTTYADLFAVLGVTYGDGNGTTTFNLPDYRGRFMRGTANGSTQDPDRASRTDRGDGTTGDNVGTKQADELESHTHQVQNVPAVSDRENPGAGSNIARAFTNYTSTATGGSETRPVNINVNYIIKT